MSFVTGLTCVACGHTDPEGASEYTCTRCGGIRDVEYDYERVRSTIRSAGRPQDLRRYLPLLPVQPNGVMPPLLVGWTPLYEAPRTAALLGVRRLWLKDEGGQPTGSFKDRASWVGVTRCAQAGRPIIAAASTGNAATSVAGLGASLGLQVYIFVPATAPEAKVAQLCTYGAKLFLVEADYDATYDLCQKAVAQFGWYNRSAAVNPYLVEGKKTCGLELAEQLQNELPDWVAMSVGDGCSLAATYKGLVEMRRLGFISRVPRFLAVQAAGAAPLTKAFATGTEAVERIEAHSVADSISVGMPRNPIKVLRAVRDAEGAFVNVEDDAILGWIPRLAQSSGVFGEPAAVTAVAGIEAARAQGIIRASETVAAVITGNGLKDVRAAMRAVQRPPSIQPNLEAVAARLEAP